MTRFLLILEMGAAIAGLLAIQAVALYAVWWLVMWVLRFVPTVGKRHRHPRWDELNERQDGSHRS